jgi:cysteinyl-tRNA synthetase
MPFIRNMDELKVNINTLESYRNDTNTENLDFYKRLIQRGRCFVTYERNDEIHFGPSRFMGYANNNMEDHNQAILQGERDGRETNPVLDRIIGPHEANQHLEKEFIAFCNQLGIMPWNVRRTFWGAI